MTVQSKPSPYSANGALARIRKFNRWYAKESPAALGACVDGVNVTGYLRDESGWGAATRGYISALAELGLPLAFNDVSSLSTNRSEDTPGIDGGHGTPYEVNLVCVDAAQHFGALEIVGDAAFDEHYNIAAWAWELPQFPEEWYDRFAYYDEIWVGTSFIASALAPIAPVPVVRVPPVLTPRAEGDRSAGRELLSAGDDAFVFLFMLDFHSHLERKNPLAVIQAYREAFGGGDKTHLVIKSVNGASDPGGLSAVRSAARGSSISVLDGYWPASQVRDLVAACDCYVSLHRSEGTGLTISDAMAAGKPVIATGWSGNMDFMTIANSFPVAFDLVEIAQSVGPYRAGQMWAQPSVEDAAARMRQVVDERSAAEAKGLVARRDIFAGYSPKAVGRIISQRLDVIGSRRLFVSLRGEIRSFRASYIDLVAQLGKVVRAHTSKGDVVLVASKGDSKLVAFDDRVGAHFPQTIEGAFAGYHPSSSAEAVEHLEELRERGATHFLLPGTSLWWLDYYGEFYEHLQQHHTLLVSDERCVLYSLNAAGALASEGGNSGL